MTRPVLLASSVETVSVEVNTGAERRRCGSAGTADVEYRPQVGVLAGVGRSCGPKCSDLDFATELAAYRAPLAVMENFDFLDTSRIYVLGFSNGGGFALLVADDSPVSKQEK